MRGRSGPVRVQLCEEARHSPPGKGEADSCCSPVPRTVQGAVTCWWERGLSQGGARTQDPATRLDLPTHLLGQTAVTAAWRQWVRVSPQLGSFGCHCGSCGGMTG